ncbi:MAG: hypothetical protein V3V18_00355, partial [Methylococcales bacterium]
CYYCHVYCKLSVDEKSVSVGSERAKLIKSSFSFSSSDAFLFMITVYMAGLLLTSSLIASSESKTAKVKFDFPTW